MGLRQHREAPAGEALDEPQLPQGPAAVERLGEHPARETLELALAAGAWQRRVTDVVAHVEMGIVHPHRAALVERHERQPLPVAGHEVESRLDRLDQLVIRWGGADEHRAARHVHVGRVALEMQKRAVEAGQPVLVRHRSDGSHRRARATAVGPTSIAG